MMHCGISTGLAWALHGSSQPPVARSLLLAMKPVLMKPVLMKPVPLRVGRGFCGGKTVPRRCEQTGRHAVTVSTDNGVVA